MIEFEWDEEKNRRNRAKHGVSFQRARAVFADSFAQEKLDNRDNYGEERWLTVGISHGQMLAVINTQRGERYRLISARKATREEINAYYKNRSGA